VHAQIAGLHGIVLGQLAVRRIVDTVLTDVTPADNRAEVTLVLPPV
jgi:hypothetical protein